MNKREIAMSNETDLDWLARNVNVWPTETDFVFVGTGISNGNIGWFPADYCFSKSSLVTRQQWLDRRAELQNKPSWNGSPEWAKFLGQDSLGRWLWHERKPRIDDERFTPRKGVFHVECSGLVIGDWRDTLEMRPEEFKPSIEEANMLAQELKPFISIEDNQEQEMKQDNGWFERGELPPVGIECEFRRPVFGWVGCDVVGHYRLRAVCAPDGGNFFAGSASDFRPILTERDELIEIIASNLSGTTGQVADAILAAGFKVEAK